jgi:hypothetical protein
MSFKDTDWKTCYNIIVQREIVNSCYMLHSFKTHAKINIWHLVTILQSQTWVFFDILRVLWTWTKYMWKCWPWCELELRSKLYYLKSVISLLWACQHTDRGVRLLCMNNEKGYIACLYTVSGKSFGWCISYWHP